MTSTTRWLSPVASRPADYPEELPFLSDRGCLLSKSGAGEAELFSVLWPASVMWPADLLRQPLESAVGSREAAYYAIDQAAIWRMSRRVAHEASVAQPDEASTVFDLVCERSREAGWSGGKRTNVGSDVAWRYGGGTAWFEKGPRVRLVTATAAGVTLQEGLPEREAARDSA